ncbi:MAG: hypothetical protein H3C53_01605 [Trueperaceae bacterium]|nr:hypothetical protein [Trueperaceae bacterium]
MTDYPEATLNRLLDAAAEVLLATVASDRTGIVGYFREVMAAGRYLYDAERKYADNALVMALFTHTRTSEGVANDEPLTRERLLGRLGEVGELVRDDAEGLEFKRFLFDLAVHVSRASGAPFRPRVSTDEAGFLSQLKALLRMPD